MIEKLNNHAIGVDAAKIITIGKYNILVGIGAGANLTIGSRNIIIGDGLQAPSPDIDNYINLLGVIEITDYGTEKQKGRIHAVDPALLFGQVVLRNLSK